MQREALAQAIGKQYHGTNSSAAAPGILSNLLNGKGNFEVLWNVDRTFSDTFENVLATPTLQLLQPLGSCPLTAGTYPLTATMLRQKGLWNGKSKQTDPKLLSDANIVSIGDKTLLKAKKLEAIHYRLKMKHQGTGGKPSGMSRQDFTDQVLVQYQEQYAKVKACDADNVKALRNDDNDEEEEDNDED